MNNPSCHSERSEESLNRNESFHISREWRREIKRRCDELDSGKVATIPSKAVFAEARSVLSLNKQSYSK
jgi:hypothetical protein